MLCQLLLSCVLSSAIPDSALNTGGCTQHWLPLGTGSSDSTEVVWCAPCHRVPGWQLSCAAVETGLSGQCNCFTFPKAELNLKTLLIRSHGQSFQVLPQPDRTERAGPSGLQGKLEVLLDSAALEPMSLQLCTLLLCSPQLH